MGLESTLMSDRKPLMPKATAVWLVANTSLAFDQIAEFCGLHHLEVKGIADGDVAQGIRGMDPIANGQLTRDEIARAEKNDKHKMKVAVSKVEVPVVKTKRGPRYTPVSKRHDRPNAVLWLIKSHPELKESQLMRLVGTTKPTIAAIRDRTHWNSQNLVAQDPVTLGICTQVDLDAEVEKAGARVAKERKGMPQPMEPAGVTLQPTERTIPGMGPQPTMDLPAERPSVESERSREAQEAAELLAQLRGMGTKKTDEDDEVGDENVSG
jgi:uncharacterized protein